MNRKAIIFGIKSYTLTVNEKKFFKKHKPWGIILFSRNINSISQLKILVDEIKKIFNDKKFPILIDQEGGKVSRLNKIINLDYFSQKFFGELYKSDKKLFYSFYKIYIDTVSDLLISVGININTVPVLDIFRKKSHKVIGNRSFSSDPYIVSKLGKLCIKHYEKNKIATVYKHIPGHGLSFFDSHFDTPVVKTSKKSLVTKDFKPFKLCKSIFAMTAHIIYSKYDSKNTATHSKSIINNVIRNHIKFKGILISDDISMKSLKYSIEENAIRALNAGCNLVLHCNANINEMQRISKVIPKIDYFTFKKTSLFRDFLG